MLSLSAVALSFAPAPLRAPQSVCRAGAVSMESAADLKALADKCNPLVGFWCAAAAGRAPLRPAVVGCGASRRLEVHSSPPASLHSAGTR